MKLKIIGLTVLALGQAGQVNAMAVFDSANFGNTIQQVVTGTQQLAEMKSQVQNGIQQLQQLKDQFTNLSGVTGIGDLANIGTSARNILPQNLASATSFGNSDAIASAKKIMDLANTSIKPDSAAGKLYTEERRQNAVNAAATEAAYQASFDRMSNIQQLLDQIEQSPSAKQIADLQARIQVEQVFMQNESLRLAAMTQMQQAQKDIRQQQEEELFLQDSQRTTSTRF